MAYVGLPGSSGRVAGRPERVQGPLQRSQYEQEMSEMRTRYRRPKGTPDAVTSEGYEAQCLLSAESAIVIDSTVRAGGAAPARHVHEHSDQLYYVTHGTMHVELGNEVFTAGPDTLVYIPRGTPHHNWNPGDVDEHHFEV